MSTGKPALICRPRHRRRFALMRGWHAGRVLDVETARLAWIVQNGTR